MIEQMTPDLLLAGYASVVLLLTAVIGFGGGRIFGEATKTKTVVREKIPTELKRLAKVLKIKEDVPETQAYGRMIHDLFEERDGEILDLKDKVLTLEDRADAAEEEVEHLQLAKTGLIRDKVAVENKLREERNLVAKLTAQINTLVGCQSISGTATPLSGLYERADEYYGKLDAEKGTTLTSRGTVYGYFHDRNMRLTARLAEEDVLSIANCNARPSAQSPLPDREGLWVSPHSNSIYLVGRGWADREIATNDGGKPWKPGFYPFVGSRTKIDPKKRVELRSTARIGVRARTGMGFDRKATS